MPKASGGDLKNIWVPLSGQIAQQRKVETIANNIANANTAGFKKDQLAFKEHLTSLSKNGEVIDLPRKEWSPDDFYRSQGGENAFVKVDGSYTDFKQGALSPTNNPLDFALSGKGFFEVLTPQGIRYTRNGSFSLGKNGELITSQGFKLLGRVSEEQEQTNGNDDAIEARIIKVPTDKGFSVSTSGEVFSSNGKVADISVVEFKDPHALRKQGQNLFINNDSTNIVRNDIETVVRQNFIEGSNVNAIKEMSELINAHRHFENIQQAIKTYDQISGRIVNDIADFR